MELQSLELCSPDGLLEDLLPANHHQQRMTTATTAALMRTAQAASEKKPPCKTIKTARMQMMDMDNTRSTAPTSASPLPYAALRFLQIKSEAMPNERASSAMANNVKTALAFSSPVCGRSPTG